jgi:hypothetical protein
MDVGEDMQEALMAYAMKQAQILLEKGELFARQWYPLLMAHGGDPEWPARFLVDCSGGEEMKEVDWMDDEEDGIDDDLDDIFD